MRTLIELFDDAQRRDTLLVLLPPAESRLEDFYAQGFVSAVRERNIAVDLALADTTYQHVMSKTVVAALHQHVVLPAQVRGYRQIWLAGISLGAFSALYYASAHADHLAGMHLMAPYPGTGDILAEIVAAGGPAAWARNARKADEDERAWWNWLCREAQAGTWPMPVYFGTGTEDRFLRGQRLLAELLPREKVRYLPGPHAWPTWRSLWQDWLDHGPLAARPQRKIA